MRRLIYILCAVISVITCAPFAFSTTTDDILAVRLPSGLQVIVAEDRSVNLAAVDIWIRSGCLYEPPGKNGVSHFVEHMIFKATDKFGPGEIDRIIEGVGAEANGGTSRDWQHFYTTVTSEHLELVLDVLADAISNARFDPAEIEKERGIIIDEIARAESDLMQFAVRKFYETAYTVHPYKYPPTGTRDSIAGLSRQDIVDYYNARYKPDNTIVVIVGNVNKTNAVALVEKKFRNFVGKSSSQPIPAEPASSEPRILKVENKSNQTYVVVGYQGPSVSNFKDCCALDVASAVLGDTYRGRLCSALINKRIPFAKISVDFTTQRDPSVFFALVVTEPQNTDKVARLVLDEMRRLGTEGITHLELVQAKKLIEGSVLFEEETVSGKARALGLYETIGSYRLALDYIPAIRSITEQDVLIAARKYVSGSAYTIVSIGPSGIEQ